MTEEERLEEKRRREADEVTRDARTVFVSSLVVRASDDDVRGYFEAVGKVKDVQLIKDKAGKSKGFGYVEFADLDSVPPALLLNGQPFCMKHRGCVCSGLPVTIKPSEAEKNYEAAALSSVAQLSSRLYVGNLPGDAHQSELRDLFKSAGEVVDVVFPRGDKDARTYAFIQYKDQECAQRAAYEFVDVKLRDHPLKVGYLTGPNTVVSPTGEMWEITAKGLSAQDRAAIISRLSGATQQAAVDLGVNLAAGRPAVKAPSVMGVAGLPTALFGTGPQGVVSRAIVLKNMFDPSAEAEAGWEEDVEEDVKEECGKFGTVSFVKADPLSPGHVFVFFTDLHTASAAANAICGRKFGGKPIEVDYIPESILVSKFPSTNFASA